ncbi:MAG TPA: valine--tRNA ligase [Candidatus Saccharibacteria bacterium]|nr:valine--tRNA ligase [Candidatus Saccharibacteria bacterium]
MKLSKAYEAHKYEKDIYTLWEKTGVFEAHPERKAERFSISMPPPNETGTLSIGHALFLTLQDIMARYQRMNGKDVLWLPGTDHAALPVNAIIEKKLSDEGTDKHEVGREEFLRRTREFVGGSRDTMVSQMRAMGASCDWSRQRYTLDAALNRCVNETFTKMYNDGLIYRGHRIVNWDPKLETTIADDEVERKEERTKFYTFQYGPFQISTARPETKFGDKYVVMHPNDKRYKKYKHGDTFEAEWINGPVTATVIKDAAVDPEFGTGVMTITPWHDHTDFEIAERHKLDKEQIIDFHGKLLPIAGEFSGMTIEKARPLIVEKLDKKGLLVSVDNNYVHNIAINERGKGIIEPQIKLQWFVDVNKRVVNWKGKERSLKEVMRDVIDSNDINIVPERFNKTYFHWIDNLRDWCISRQIWWGHRIPVWYRTVDEKLETYVGVLPPEKDDSEGFTEWEQDSDTLDTWFSSALWTWSTLIDPALAEDNNLSLQDILKKSPDFMAYHPTSVMETGWDILFFWVARMILATTYMTGQVPFKTVYLHGMVRAEDGKKMSKSRPDSIVNPLDVIEKFGTDALRMALIMGVSPGNDQNWGQGKIEATRNFCNKLWNIARFVQETIGTERALSEPWPESAADNWILTKLQRLSDQVSSDLDNLRLSEAFDKLYHFVWDDFADWYIEASKLDPNHHVLEYTLSTVLRLMHPFAPFVTETIWQELGWYDEILAVSTWPIVPPTDKRSAKQFDEIKRIVTECRQLSKALKVTKPTLYHQEVGFMEQHGKLIARLARLGGVELLGEGDEGLKLATPKKNTWLAVDEQTIKSYAKELKSKLLEQKQQKKLLEERLDNDAYVQHAPNKIVQQTRDQLATTQAVYDQIEQELARFA